MIRTLKTELTWVFVKNKERKRQETHTSTPTGVSGGGSRYDFMEELEKILKNLKH